LAKKRVETIEELNNVYFVYGDEELLVEQALTRLKNLFSAEADADFNMEVINALETGAEHVVDSAETIPLMASRRLVIARNVDKLSKKEQETIAAYLDRPNPATTLVLVASVPAAGEHRDSNIIKKVEGNALFKKATAVGGEPLKFSWAPRGRQKKTEDWVTDEFKRRGKKIDGAARDMLVETLLSGSACTPRTPRPSAWRRSPRSSSPRRSRGFSSSSTRSPTGAATSRCICSTGSYGRARAPRGYSAFCCGSSGSSRAASPWRMTTSTARSRRF
jgi:hypothetical protein